MKDRIKVHMLKAGVTFEGTTEEVCQKIVAQIEAELQEGATR